ncbi:MAG TPA: hypothetical protein VMG35_30660 [Bryobacteraceae bacterium]|nr:hypothetical protein [Bryobacteraceae bacterium]
MRSSFLTILVLCLAVLIATAPLMAADKPPAKGKINGTVQQLNKDTSTITVRKGNIQRQVVYNADTKWQYGMQGSAKVSTLDQLKEGWYINCDGTFDGTKLVASACRFRESK